MKTILPLWTSHLPFKNYFYYVDLLKIQLFPCPLSTTSYLELLFTQFFWVLNELFKRPQSIFINLMQCYILAFLRLKWRLNVHSTIEMVASQNTISMAEKYFCRIISILTPVIRFSCSHLVLICSTASQSFNVCSYDDLGL